MADVPVIVSNLWQTTQAWASPASTDVSLSNEEAYLVQLQLLEKWKASGETQVGWKIGATSDGSRKTLGLPHAISGYLLKNREFSSGHYFSHATIPRPIIESELCFVLSKDLQGPGVTRADVASAIASVHPAFEIVDMRVSLRDHMALGIADNCVQWAFVVGEGASLNFADFDLGEVTVEMKRNGEHVETAVGKSAIDNQLESIAWLANHLSSFGYSLSAGQKIMTGTFTKPTPINKGDRWESSFSGVGSVSATFE